METILDNANNVINGDDLRINIKDDPELYRAHYNQVQMDNVLFLERYKTKIKWKQTGDRSIDLGCGEGGMTSKLEKYLPPNYEALVGCDMNAKMVEFANRKYGTNRVSFHVQDIEGDIPNDWRENFHHVFSFHALHYVRNQEKMFVNIFDLLAKGGDCLLLFVVRHPVYDLYLALSKMEKWAPYLKNVDKFLSPYYECQEPDKKILDMMEEIGFRSVDVRSKQMLCVDTTLETLKNFAHILSPFYDQSALREDFLADADEIFRGLRLVHQTEDGSEVTKCPYTLMLVYATK